jgi:hypothetical protein
LAVEVFFQGFPLVFDLNEVGRFAHAAVFDGQYELPPIRRAS